MLKAKAGEPDEALYQRLLSRAQAQAHAVDKVYPYSWHMLWTKESSPMC